MMALLARLGHSPPGRKRVKIDEKRGDAILCDVGKELAGCDGVVAVETNPLTGTALISHATDDTGLWDYVIEHELFHLGENETAVRTLPRPAITRGTRTAEHTSYTKSGRRSDIRWLIFLAMIGMGVVQTMEGNIAVPAIGAFWYAFGILPGANVVNPEHPSQNGILIPGES
jgi:hypothetical protein